MRENPAVMQHDDIIAVGDFIDEMRGPKNRNAFCGDEVAHMTDDVGPGFDVETDRGLVENEQARPVQQRARDFETSHLTTREVAHLVFGPLGQRNAGQKVIGTLSAFVVADAVQRRMIGQVLYDGEIQVEGARLEYDTDQAQGFARSDPTS